MVGDRQVLTALTAHTRLRSGVPKLFSKKVVGTKVPSARLAEFYRSLKIDRNKLGNAPFGHRRAEQAVHPCHRDWVMGDNHEAGIGRFGHFVEEVAEAFDVVIVE